MVSAWSLSLGLVNMDVAPEISDGHNVLLTKAALTARSQLESASQVFCAPTWKVTGSRRAVPPPPE
jgi:hypothetical protein